jgi:indoleamine 2,3-dioxygenase
MPQTPLTKILHEFRAYRPLPHREFLTYIREKSEEIGVQDYAVQDSETAVLFLRTLNHIRSFRWRHWLFAREYIIRRTPHPTATGGSPIVTVSISPIQQKRRGDARDCSFANLRHISDEEESWLTLL